MWSRTSHFRQARRRTGPTDLRSGARSGMPAPTSLARGWNLCLSGYGASFSSGAWRLRVATKFVNVAKRYYAEQGRQVEVIKLYGSMELAPLVGLSDVIVDLVSTGNTLRANNLVEVEEIMDISSRLVVNQAALKLKRERLQPILEAFERASEGKA